MEEGAEAWIKGERLAGQVKKTVKVNSMSKIRGLGNGTVEPYRVVCSAEYVVPRNMV